MMWIAPHGYCLHVAALRVVFFSTYNILTLRILPFATWQGAGVHVRAISWWASFIIHVSGVTGCKNVRTRTKCVYLETNGGGAVCFWAHAC